MRWVQLCGSLSILWHCLSLRLEWKLTFSSAVATAVFHICWHIECSTLPPSSFRIWNSSTGIPSSPLALFIVMLPKAHLIRIPGSMALAEWSHHHGYLGHGNLFCIVLLCILTTSSLYLLLLLGRFIPFLSFIVPIFAWNVPLVSLIFLKRESHTLAK